MLLENLGIEPARVRLEWISAGEGERFANTMKEMVKEVKALGPIGRLEVPATQ
jgi:coenzyme F420-reducing hydrogenase delta subunit